MKLGHEFYPPKSLGSNQKYGAFLQKPQNSGKFARIFILHSNGHLSPIHEGYKSGGGGGKDRICQRYTYIPLAMGGGLDRSVLFFFANCDFCVESGPSWGRLVAWVPRQRHVRGRFGVGHPPPQQKMPSGCSHREQALTTLLTADPIGLLPPLPPPPAPPPPGTAHKAHLCVPCTNPPACSRSTWLQPLCVCLPPSPLWRGGGAGRPPRPVPLGQGVPWGGTAVAQLGRECGD